MSTRTTRPDPEEHVPGRGPRETAMQSDCERIAAVLHRYVEGELDPIRAQMLERHIAVCPECLAEKERLDLERLWLVEAAFDGPVLSARLVDKVMEPVRRQAAARARFSLWRRIAVSAAAACVVAGVLSYSYLPGIPEPGPESGAPGDPVSLTRAGSPASSPLEGSAPDSSYSPDRPVAVRVADHEGHLVPAERRLLDRGPRGAVRLAGLDGTGFNDAYSGVNLDGDGVDFDGVDFDGVDGIFGPIERGGFRVDRKSPRVIDFGLRNVSCLPVSWEDPSSLHEGSSCGIRLPSESGRRVFRVKLISRRAKTTFRFEFRDTLGIALRLTDGGERVGAGRSGEGGADHPHAASNDVDPCFPDPNADGRTDSGDIAYGLQVLYGAHAPGVYEVETTGVDPDCEETCLRA